MLKPVQSQQNSKYVEFNKISRYSSGEGICFVYNAVMKRTQAGKPFITLHLRDINGATVPGYVFDLQSPLFAGGEVTKVKNNLVLIEWDENYLQQVGLTLILRKVSVVTSPAVDIIERFRGGVPEVNLKMEKLQNFFREVLGMNTTLPLSVKNASYAEYSQGKVGGLCEHYYRMLSFVRSSDYLRPEEYKQLTATFLLYILVHSNYISAKESGRDSIELVSSLTQKVSSISSVLDMGSGCTELIHMFFGYTPKDVYVRAISQISKTVKQVDDEFALYHTIPLTQEGNAGYGTIRRYRIETE